MERPRARGSVASSNLDLGVQSRMAFCLAPALRAKRKRRLRTALAARGFGVLRGHLRPSNAPGMPEVDVKLLSPVQNATLGSIAGTIEVIILQPMLYCKNATQQKLPLTMDPRVLYRGIGMSIGNMILLTGSQFPLTGLVSQQITGGEQRQLSRGEKVLAGFLGGAISGFICAPMELVMIQQQRFGGSMLEAAGRVVRERGALTLFRGLETSCGREGLFTAGYLGMGPVFAEQLVNSYGMSQGTANFAGAAGAGVIAASLSHPLDTIKTCMQGDIERATYTDFVGTTRTLLSQEGIGRFFNGWAFRCDHAHRPPTPRTVCQRARLTSRVLRVCAPRPNFQDLAHDLCNLAHRAVQEHLWAHPLPFGD